MFDQQHSGAVALDHAELSCIRDRGGRSEGAEDITDAPPEESTSLGPLEGDTNTQWRNIR